MTANFRFAQPNTRVRLGQRKIVRVRRGQDLVEVVAWASVVAVLAMFLIDGGVKQVTDVTTGLGALSRLTALVGTDLLLIHMLLVARVPWVDRLYGLDKSTEAHKKLGKPILYLIVAHFLASLVNYAMLDQKAILAELTNLVFNVPDMLTATIALILMIAVVVSSIQIARKRLSYEAWWLIHLLSYASVFLAIPHQISTGSDIAGKPFAMFYWISLYLFVAGNIVWYRFLEPIVLSLRLGLKVETTVRESSDATSIYITGKNLEKLGYEAGQFFILRVLTKGQWWRAHPFSVSAAPNSRFVRFTIGNRGDDTSLLQTIKPGTRIVLEGPYGVFTEARRSREKVTLICAGIGAPPIRSLAESMAARPGDINIIYRTRQTDDAALVDELTDLSQRRGFKLTLLEGGRGGANSWMPAHPENIPDHARISVIAPWISESDVFICGPAAWTRSVKKSLLRAGTPEHQIHAEEFAW
ncbi:MAG: ferredoxin reductase family protein [Actinomycetales bacterium]|nr:ferredoxin reductase family protein [Actinomycetales bacterium]